MSDENKPTEQPFSALLNRLLDEVANSHNRTVLEILKVGAEQEGIVNAQADLARRVWVIPNSQKS